MYNSSINQFYKYLNSILFNKFYMLSQRLKEANKTNPEQDQFRAVHLNYKSIKIIDKFGSQFAFIQQLYLNHNNLLSLSGIQGFKNLKVFHFRFNRVQQFDELYKISNPFFLQSIAVFGNQLQMDTRANFNYLKNNLFKSLRQYNPSCLDYYRKIQIDSPKDFHLSTPLSIKLDKISNSIQKNGKNITPSTSRAGYSINLNNKIQKYPQISEYQTKKNSLSFMNSATKSSQENKNKLQYKQYEQKERVKINPFINEVFDQNQQIQNSAKTAKFQQKIYKFSSNKTNKNKKISDRFIEDQNEYLADSFYYRNLYYKSLLILKGVKYLKSENYYNSNILLKVFKGLKINMYIQKIQKDYANKKQFLLNNTNQIISSD